MATIYKIFRSLEYQNFLAHGETEGAPVDLADGYVHMSTRDQVEETAAKHFAGEDDLKLLALEPGALGDALKWERSRGGALFPHLYRTMKAGDVLWAKDLPLVEGKHDFTGLLS
ncbi:MAG: DUF952 domain-containing protein [Silicimonas sp.]|nr:DUF952 domain-containing protein [Silicimonas sp.]